VSISSRGAQANSLSWAGVVSSRGRYVLFTSDASNLVPGDTNGTADVFVRDRRTGKTKGVSVSLHGAQGRGQSDGAWLTGDGRYALFGSYAANLVPGDTNGEPDVFVRDLGAGTTERVSVGKGGAQANGSSGALGRTVTRDGRYVVFLSAATNLVPGDTNGANDVFVRDRKLGTTERVSVPAAGGQANGPSIDPLSLSGDGRFVAFTSEATNLVKGDTNGTQDVFVRTR
jgi:Tol biopolymer transport system component